MPQTPKYVTDGGLAKPQPLCRTGRAPIPHELAKYEQQSPIQALSYRQFWCTRPDQAAALLTS
jgi:hypothetical protein